MWAEVRDGFAEVRSRSWVWATLAAFCAALFTGLAPWFVLGPVVARRQYGDIGVYGLVSAALGLGTIAGSLLGIGWRPRFPMRAAMLAVAACGRFGDPLRGRLTLVRGRAGGGDRRAAASRCSTCGG